MGELKISNRDQDQKRKFRDLIHTLVFVKNKSGKSSGEIINAVLRKRARDLIG
ncbi:MAG: hypothetical protein P4N41_12365 [Negativicutes bacterium]|nr:hypothetical protein [Negativicutes bacterium]